MGANVPLQRREPANGRREAGREAAPASAASPSPGLRRCYGARRRQARPGPAAVPLCLPPPAVMDSVGSRSTASVLAELRWDDGYAVPVANAENRALEDEVSAGLRPGRERTPGARSRGGGPWALRGPPAPCPSPAASGRHGASPAAAGLPCPPGPGQGGREGKPASSVGAAEGSEARAVKRGLGAAGLRPVPPRPRPGAKLGIFSRNVSFQYFGGTRCVLLNVFPLVMAATIVAGNKHLTKNSYLTTLTLK